MRRAVLLLPLLLAVPTYACINDRDSDSLATQAKKLPDTLRVITGRFERNPPLYYQMRIARSLEELKKSPRQFDLYDDVAAAYGRLHRDTEALQTMERKRALLPAYDAKIPAVKEAWYRYYANTGTFRVHRWLGAGARSSNLSEVGIARDDIRRAIHIKPDAHFGREKYQLMTMEWIIATRQRGLVKASSLSGWLFVRDRWGFGGGAKATEGLSGLVVLGAAWQSPDIFQALADSLDRHGGVTLRYLALLRCKELLQSGHKSLNPHYLKGESMDQHLPDSEYGLMTGEAVNQVNAAALEGLFPKLRTEANAWEAQRTTYMMRRLRKGDHPDTNPHFWSGWKPAPAPSLNIPWFNRKEGRYDGQAAPFDWRPVMPLLVMSCGVLASGMLTLRFLKFRFRGQQN